MKKMLIVLLSITAITVLGVTLIHPKNAPLAESTSVESASPPIAEQTQATPPPTAARPSTLTLAENPPASTTTPTLTPTPSQPQPPLPPPTPANPPKLAFIQPLETILSPESTYEQRQLAWRQLKDTGHLDEAITDLEQRVTADPHAADSTTALGLAYYEKCGQVKDQREQAILAMKADQTLEAALNLDPSNWQARFTRTVGMTYWPPQMNKGQEIIDQFQTLIQQQESQAPQPQFARSYALLGDQYQKAGYPDYARQTWERGASLFPDNQQLQKRLAAQ